MLACAAAHARPPETTASRGSPASAGAPGACDMLTARRRRRRWSSAPSACRCCASPSRRRAGTAFADHASSQLCGRTRKSVRRVGRCATSKPRLTVRPLIPQTPRATTNPKPEPRTPPEPEPRTPNPPTRTPPKPSIRTPQSCAASKPRLTVSFGLKAPGLGSGIGIRM